MGTLGRVQSAEQFDGFMRKLDIVHKDVGGCTQGRWRLYIHKEVGGCTQGSWRLSDQMRITASIAQIDNHGSLTHSVTQEGRYRAARAAKKA